VRFWFHRRKPATPAPVQEEAPVSASLAATLEERPSPSPAPVTEIAQLRDRLHGPLRHQATGGDVRAERLFKKVKGEVDELRAALDAIHEVSEELTELDLDAVAEHPEAAAQLPAAVLVKGLLAARDEQLRLRQRATKVRAKNAKLAAEVRQLRQERSYFRGRMLTFDEVIGALHANIEDLRIGRDSHDAVGPTPAPRVLRPGAGNDAISPAEQA
jgi:uncharacterized coiled-coil DUF342 family protein